MIFNYDEQMNLISTDTIAYGGGSSTISVVGRSADGSQTAIGLRARTTSDYYLLNEEPMNYANITNWYSIVAVLGEGGEQSVETVKSESNKTIKFIENGQLYLRYNGRTYNILGY